LTPPRRGTTLSHAIGESVMQMRPAVVTGFTTMVCAAALFAQSPAPVVPGTTPLSDARIEAFLLKGKVVKTRSTGKGITGSLRVTLRDGALTHDAHVQTIDQRMPQFVGAKGVEFNFRDSWSFNVAGYRIDRLIGMNMVPVSVKRRWRYEDSAYTWWIDDVMLDEGDRLKRNVQPPSSATWNQQMQMVRLFDQLIANVDRNMGNMLIDRDWHIWMIDHTRAFRRNEDLKNEKALSRCDPALLKALKALTEEGLEKDVGRWLRPEEIRPLLARRDRIVAFFDKQVPVG